MVVGFFVRARSSEKRFPKQYDKNIASGSAAVVAWEEELLRGSECSAFFTEVAQPTKIKIQRLLDRRPHTVFAAYHTSK